MFLYDKTNILEGSGIFEVDFAPSHGPAPLMKPHCVSFIPVRYTDLYALPPSSNI